MPHVGGEEAHLGRKIAQPPDLLLVVLLAVRRHAETQPWSCCARNHPFRSMVPGTCGLFSRLQANGGSAPLAGEVTTRIRVRAANAEIAASVPAFTAREIEINKLLVKL